MIRRKRVFLGFVLNVLNAALVVREVLGCLIILIILHGVLFSFIEGKDIGSSIYFAFVTGFSIGYGDIAPVTTLGRFVAVSNGFWGIVFVGLVVAINTRALRKTVEMLQAQESAQN